MNLLETTLDIVFDNLLPSVFNNLMVLIVVRCNVRFSVY